MECGSLRWFMQGLKGRPALKAQCRSADRVAPAASALTSRIEEDEPSGLGLRCANPHKQGGSLRPANYIGARGRLRLYAANAGVAPIERALARFDSMIEVSIEFRRPSSETV